MKWFISADELERLREHAQDKLLLDKDKHPLNIQSIPVLTNEVDLPYRDLEGMGFYHL